MKTGQLEKMIKRKEQAIMRLKRRFDELEKYESMQSQTQDERSV